MTLYLGPNEKVAAMMPQCLRCLMRQHFKSSNKKTCNTSEAAQQHNEANIVKYNIKKVMITVIGNKNSVEYICIFLSDIFVHTLLFYIVLIHTRLKLSTESVNLCKDDT